MSSRAEEMVRRRFLSPFERKTEPYQVGVEVEMPLVNRRKEPVEPEFAKELVECLRQQFYFCVSAVTSEGYPAEAVSPAGDVFSFETSLNTIEFAMAKDRDLRSIKTRLDSYLTALQQLCRQRSYLVCGMGINPYAQYADARALHTPVLQAKAAFLREFTTHHNGEIFHAFSASTQTHLDVSLASLPDRLNLFGELSFADALLFSNSLPFRTDAENGWAVSLPQCLRTELNKQTLCFRDVLWKLCEAPNTEAPERAFSSVDDVVRHLLSLKLFIVGDGGEGYRPIKPIECAEYFSSANDAAGNDDRAEKDFRCFRPLEPVSVSRYGTIEIRQTCTQPLSDLLVPAAFYVGISENSARANALVSDFRNDNRITKPNSKLRHMAVCGEEIVPQRTMEPFLKELVTAAQEGLKKRGLNEENLLGRLLQQENGFECPAQRQIRLRQDGRSPDEILLAFSIATGENDRTVCERM